MVDYMLGGRSIYRQNPFGAFGALHHDLRNDGWSQTLGKSTIEIGHKHGTLYYLQNYFPRVTEKGPSSFLVVDGKRKPRSLPHMPEVHLERVPDISSADDQ